MTGFGVSISRPPRFVDLRFLFPALASRAKIGGHADRFWALALVGHAAEDFKTPLAASIARKPVEW